MNYKVGDKLYFYDAVNAKTDCYIIVKIIPRGYDGKTELYCSDENNAKWYFLPSTLSITPEKAIEKYRDKLNRKISRLYDKIIDFEDELVDVEYELKQIRKEN